MDTGRRLGFIDLVTPGTLLVAMLATPAAGQVTDRMSVATGGAQASFGGFAASISPDGRYVAFVSSDSNLVVGDTNGKIDVFVRDRQSGTTERVSVATGGAQGNEESTFPSISVNGRYVAFESWATNLAAGDTNGFFDIFVHDRQSGTTERVSVDSAGGQGNGPSEATSISADGRYVAFESDASNLVAGDTNAVRDVFLHDRQSGTTERVSVATGGVQGNLPSEAASISADGRYAAFASQATNLVAGDTNGHADVFVRDRQSGTTERVSVATGGAQGNFGSEAPLISADGRYVTFESYAINLVSGDTNADDDVFVHDCQSGTTERVSVDSGGAQGNGASEAASISADGRYVVFHSWAPNLVAGDTNGDHDVFFRDRQSGTTERVSVATLGVQGNDESNFPSISADGRFVAFNSHASNLVAGDTNGVYDVFVHDRDGEIGTKYCAANANSTGFPADISALGSPSAAAGNLFLISTPVPFQQGIFFHGMNPSQTPFGNGFLCTSGGIARGSVVVPAGNSAVYTYNNSDDRHSLQNYVGSTRHFQHWFRDPMGGGALFNTSNAVSILIEP